MIGMGSGGVKFITGTITPDAAGTVTINFGKTLSKYILLIEMDDASITMLENAGISTNKTYTFLGMNIFKQIGSIQPSSQSLAVRYNGAGATATSVTTITMNTSSFKATTADVSGSLSNALWVGYTYNYTIIPLE